MTKSPSGSEAPLTYSDTPPLNHNWLGGGHTDALFGSHFLEILFVAHAKIGAGEVLGQALLQSTRGIPFMGIPLRFVIPELATGTFEDRHHAATISAWPYLA